MGICFLRTCCGRGKGSIASDHGADCKNGCRDTGGTSDRERRPVIQCCGGITSRRYPGNDPEEKHPSYGEFYEGRHFTPGEETVTEYQLSGREIPFGINLLFRCTELPELVIGCEICEDLWVAEPPSTSHALAGATVIANLSASNETVSKDDYRMLLVKSASARLLCGYIYTSAGEGESTQDLVFGGHDLIAENGTLLVQSSRFSSGIVYADLDVLRIVNERRRMGTFGQKPEKEYRVVPFSVKLAQTRLDRKFAAHPFVPEDPALRNRRCEDILSIQAYGLKKRGMRIPD